MAVVLPPAAAGMMQMLGPWPNMNEDDVRAEGNAARVAHSSTAPAASGADSAVRATQQVYRGESATSMENHWNRTGAQGGHVAQANAAMQVMPVALDGTASVVSAVKVAAGTQAVFTAVGVAKALAFGGVVGATVATARVLASRQAVRKILREGSEGTGKVIAPIVRRRVTEPMRRILDDLRGPGGPGSRLAAAGPRGVVPLRSSGLRNPSGPRSIKDGIAQMGRRNNRNNQGNGRGRGSGGGSGRSGGFFSRNSNNGSRHDGRVHGDPPTSAKGMTEAEAKRARDMLKKSIKTRKAEEDRKGWEAGHAERIRREERALKDLEDSIRRRQFDETPSSSSSGGTYSGGSQASADRYPTDAEYEQQKKNRRW
ncbi:hypothetical protein OHA25_22815 [Nonomuraea sp. NBC_00507]|uniref:hypothetical protein n=1 Tax=Nonomuraea sp. NBC_00507 TaxID=2976002 RepID=UPI002E177773